MPRTARRDPLGRASRSALATPHEAIDARHQRRPPGSRAVPASDRRRQPLPRRRDTSASACCSSAPWSATAQTILDDLGFAPAGRRAALRASPSASSSWSPPRAPPPRGTRFLIFDEPTAYLTRQEAAQLFALIRRLKHAGRHHRLYQPPHGGGLPARRPRLGPARRAAGRHPRVATPTRTTLIARMINRSIDQVHHKERSRSARDPARRETSRGTGFEDVSLTRARGRDRRPLRPDRRRAQRVRAEPVRPLPARPAATDLLAGQAGRHPPRDATPSTAASRSCPKAGATRASASICGVGFNLNLPIYRAPDQGRHDQPLAPRRAAADRQIRDLQIKTASRDALASSLSGGNQQKIVVGKWLNHGAELFIFDEPTVGVDVGTKVEIYKLFAKLLQGRRRHHPDLVLPAGGLRSVRHAARVPAGRLVPAMSARRRRHETILTEAIGV